MHDLADGIEGECDACGKHAILHRVFYNNIETFACAVCLHLEPEEPEGDEKWEC